MPSLRQYHLRYGGEVEIREIPMKKLHATRPFVHKEKIEKYISQHSGPYKPCGVLLTDNIYYLVDGHHKAVANFIDGSTTVFAEVLITDNPKAPRDMQRRDHGTLDKLVLNIARGRSRVNNQHNGS
ncbi:hypothetical protein GOV08_03620 [Candidatus Woesearchaeota archaeon]|nr:hypothetical protein [Candidatus Woesearchaeota archaeon]